MAYPIASEVITRVRSLLQDSTIPYRYTDADVINAINDGVARCVALRSDAFLSVSFQPATITGTSTAVEIPTAFMYPLALFVAGFLLLRDDEYADSGRAIGFISGAEKTLTKEGGIA